MSLRGPINGVSPATCWSDMYMSVPDLNPFRRTTPSKEASSLARPYSALPSRNRSHQVSLLRHHALTDTRCEGWVVLSATGEGRNETMRIETHRGEGQDERATTSFSECSSTRNW